MVRLDLYRRGLTSLDGIDLTGVTELLCSTNRLISLPELPSTLLFLDCSINCLTYLPDQGQGLPPNLKKLNCSYNQLTVLCTTDQGLPSTLEELFCYSNQLTSLPKLPSTLKGLYCSNNQLTSLPKLPFSLRILFCANNHFFYPLDLPYYLKILHVNGVDSSKTKICAKSLKLEQHNEKRKKLGLEQVRKLPKKDIWDEINERFISSQYEPGGYMFEQAQQEIIQLLLSNRN